MASISSPGIGSGLDVNSLVSQLMTVERAPIKLLDTKVTSYNAKLSAYGTLKSSLAALQTAAKAISTVDTFTPTSASAADSTILSVTSSASAIAGTYDVEVQSLANSQKLMMSAPGGATGYAATDSVVGQGTITINFGTYAAVGATAVAPALATDTGFTVNPAKLTPKTIAIDSGNNTLAGIRDAINAANAGVSASIVNDGTTTGYRLALTSSDSGARNAMQISVAGASGDLAQLNYDASTSAGVPAATSRLAQNVAATDAVIKVDNVTYTKQSNTITDAIQGVTLNLSKTMAAGTTDKITVARNTSNVKAAVDAFVKAYNDTNTAIKAATAYDASTGKSAILAGDSTVRSVQTQMRALLGAPVAGAPAGMTVLSNVGISFQADGSLATDATKFAAALADPSKDLSKLFTSTGSIKGYGWQMNVLLGKLISPVGPMTNHANSFSASIKSIGTQQASINARLVGIEARYRAQFTALDTMVASMTTTSTFLTQQLASLANNA